MHGLIARSCSQPFTVRTKNGNYHVAVMNQRRHEGGAGHGVPNANGVVGRGCDDAIAHGREFSAMNLTMMLQGRTKRTPCLCLPYPGGLITGGGDNATAVRTEP